MGIQFNDVNLDDLNEIPYEDVDSSGFPAAGRYHVELLSVDTDEPGNGKTPCELLEFRILAGTTAGQAGKKFTERVYHYGRDPKATLKVKQRAQGLGKRMGIYSAEDKVEGLPVEFEEAINGEFIAELIEQKSEDGTKTYTKMSYMGLWPVGHEDVRDVPLARKTGRGHEDGNAGGAGQGAKPQTPPRTGGQGAGKPQPPRNGPAPRRGNVPPRSGSKTSAKHAEV